MTASNREKEKTPANSKGQQPQVADALLIKTKQTNNRGWVDQLFSNEPCYVLGYN